MQYPHYDSTSRPECHNTMDLYNPGDMAAARINSDYGRKLGVGTASGNPLARHAVSQFQTPQGAAPQGATSGQEGGKKKRKASSDHPQQMLLDLAYQIM